MSRLAQLRKSNCATRHTRHRACKQSPRSTVKVGIFRTYLSTLATRILQYWLSWVKLVCPRYLCALLMGLLGEHQTLISCLPICCLDLNDLPIAYLKCGRLSGPMRKPLKWGDHCQIAFWNQNGVNRLNRAQIRQLYFYAAESELRRARSADLRSVTRRYVLLSTCSCMFIGVKPVFTGCSNHAFYGEQQRQRMRVCVFILIVRVCVRVCE